jgi:hypothetical protein
VSTEILLRMKKIGKIGLMNDVLTILIQSICQFNSYTNNDNCVTHPGKLILER